MAAETTGHALHDAAGASLRVVESAVALARAEGTLVVVRARTMFVGSIVMALGVLVAVSFAQLTLILVTVAPLFVAPGAPFGLPLPRFLVAIGLAICLLIGGGLVAWWGFRQLGEHSPGEHDGGEA